MKRWTSAQNALVDDCHSNGRSERTLNIFRFASRHRGHLCGRVSDHSAHTQRHLRSHVGVGSRFGVPLFWRLLGLGLIMWFVRDVQDPCAPGAVLAGSGFSNLAGVRVALWGTATGIMNGLEWTVVVLYAALAAGCFYFRTADRILTFDSFQIGAMRRKV